MMKRLTIFLLLLGLSPLLVKAQEAPYTRADTLRGSLSVLRSCYDVTYYDLQVKVDPATQRIAGSNGITFKVKEPFTRIQLDLFANLSLDSVVWHDQSLPFTREGNAFFVTFPKMLIDGSDQIRVYYHGQPTIAKRPPWDGGFTWSKGLHGKPWVVVSCEGIGASLWWPNKDYLGEEPDSMRIAVTTPSDLFCVANGNLEATLDNGKGWKEYVWKVHYPINNYDVSLNIADYAHFQDTYTAEDGSKMPLDYYVLNGKQHVDSAKVQFQQVQGMLKAYEHYFGKYPFWKDGYALVETPYWGMEHQSAVAYGNHFKNNKFGFDFIIIHESGHEYWGNSISVQDHAEMWIHEAFTTYMEALYLEYKDGYDTAIKYLEMQKTRIKNKQTILGPIGVNYNGWEAADMYYKGTWMLHSIRNTIDDKEKWFSILHDLYQHFQHSTVTTPEILDFINARTEMDLTPIFEQYLTTVKVPVLEYRVKDTRKSQHIEYRWTNAVNNFNMPVKVKVDGGDYRMLHPSADWQSIDLHKGDVHFATELFYFNPKKVE